MADNVLVIEAQAKLTEALKAVRQFNNSLKETQPAAASAAKGVTDLNKAAGSTTQTLTNVGRVVQDLPFGLIGIANNLDPLLASFQQLKQQSGGLGPALKSLGSALIGPAGIAIALSAVTSILIKYGDEINAALFGTSKFATELNEIESEGAKAFFAAQREATKLFDILTDGSESIGAQREAFDDLNTALGKYDIKLTSLASTQENAAEIAAVYAAIKSQEAKSLKLAELAAEAYAKQVLAIKAAQEADVSSFSSGLNVFLESLKGNIVAATAVAGGLKTAVSETKDETKFWEKELDKSDATIKQLIDGLKAGGLAQENFKNQQKEAAAAAKAAAAEAKQQAEEEARRAKAISDYISKLKEEQNTVIGTTELYRKYAQTKDFLAKQDKKNFEDLIKIQKEGLAAPANLANAVKISDTITGAAAQNTQKVAEEAKKAADQVFNIQNGFNLLTPLVEQTFDALANGSNAFDSLIQGTKRLIVELIKAAALAAILAAVTGGFGSGAAGGGFLNIFKGLLGFRAAGGSTGGGNPYVVGERGPELFIPGRSGTIIPNNRLAMANAGGGQLVARVSGSDLLFIMNKAQSSRGTF